MHVYAAFNYCISHVELGQVYIIPGIIHKKPSKRKMYKLFILTASRLEFHSSIRNRTDIAFNALTLICLYKH